MLKNIFIVTNECIIFFEYFLTEYQKKKEIYWTNWTSAASRFIWYLTVLYLLPKKKELFTSCSTLKPGNLFFPNPYAFIVKKGNTTHMHLIIFFYFFGNSFTKSFQLIMLIHIKRSCELMFYLRTFRMSLNNCLQEREYC